MYNFLRKIDDRLAEIRLQRERIVSGSGTPEEKAHALDAIARKEEELLKDRLQYPDHQGEPLSPPSKEVNDIDFEARTVQANGSEAEII